MLRTATTGTFMILLLFIYAISAPGSTALAQSPPSIATPRPADITAILDQEKQDPRRAAKSRADADADPPSTQNKNLLAEFYFRRAQARSLTGRSREAISDAEMAIRQAGTSDTERYEAFISNAYSSLGDHKRVIEINLTLAKRYGSAQKGKNFSFNLRLIQSYLALGDIAAAEIYDKKSQTLLNETKGWKNFSTHGSFFGGYTQSGHGRVLQARGLFRDAELAYHNAHALLRDAIIKSKSWPQQPFQGAVENQADFILAAEGAMKARQGRLTEAEADIRRALLSRLQFAGKYHASSAQLVRMLAQLLAEQGRFREAEQLLRIALDIYRGLGYLEGSKAYVQTLKELGDRLYNQEQYKEAGEIYALLDDASKGWGAQERVALLSSPDQIFLDYNIGRTEAGIELAHNWVAREKARVGEKHLDYAMAQAILGVGLARAGKDSDALRAYKVAVPIILGSSREADDDPVERTGYERRMARVIQPYLGLLARTRNASNNNAAESFQLGELIRRQSVQKAVVASSARAAARNPQLAELVRKEQDLQKQVAVRLDAMNTIFALPPEERDEKAAASLRSETEKLNAQRAATRRQIEQRFPGYADLIAAKPAALEDVRAALGPGEAFLSFYVATGRTFVWAVPKEGPVAFASVALTAADIDAKVQKLRASLEPQATSIRDIPPFDLALAHELYLKLLKPVESGWKSAKNLIVVTNGALGYLPLGLLPTGPVELKPDGGSLFSNYRDVPWLARTHTVTLVPSAMALRTLRQSPPGSNKREPMIGFGDPYFNSEQAAEAEELERASIVVAAADAATVTRSPVLARRSSPQTIDSPEIATLPRLPDTAAELKSIAVALKADPSKALYLGMKANEKTVKDTDLSRFRVVAFATHGLLPGDLDGLTQPALAMTAPAVAGVPGDGLLTMEEILALKLDADWVVLSACNTGAGAGLGAEAVSGLGRAFFYAGTRAILVTNWSVHSQSARELVTDIFRRQAADSKLSRAEALRQAMMALLDGKGFTDEKGATVFTYAHPLFWAPYTIVGNGGG
jgi:CHAT domain-containing protein